MSMVTRFDPRPLPVDVAATLRARLERAHRERPFSTVDCRETVRRAGVLVGELGMRTTVYRGSLDLRGAEVDHLWLAVRPGDADDHRGYVVDVAFPLFAPAFVEILRRFVAGDAADRELATAAESAGFDERVLGVFPSRLTYLGAPVWSGADR